MNKTRSGFTIVELLIVIVVIGILAAITIVAYNGIQVRSRNAQQLSAAKTYLGAFASYAAINGTYPSYGSRVCLNLDQSACVSNVNWARDPSLETALKTVVSTLPTASSGTPLTGNPKMGYVPQTSDVTLDGVSRAFLIYTIEAPATCTTGTPASLATWPNYSSAVPAQGYTANENNNRICWIPMPRV